MDHSTTELIPALLVTETNPFGKHYVIEVITRLAKSVKVTILNILHY